MRGTTHFKAGALYYGIYTVIPFIPTIPFMGEKPQFTIWSMFIAGVVSLFADADEKNSQINRINPITGLSIMFIEKFEKILKVSIRLALTTGLGIIILMNFSEAVRIIDYVPILKKYSKTATVAITVILILLGFTHNSTVKKIPFIGTIFKFITETMHVLFVILKRFIVMAVYIGIGIVLMVYNFRNQNDLRLYLAAGIFISAGVFKHRSVLHSLDGFLIFIIAAQYVLKVIGHYEYMPAVFVGYFTHLLLTDMLTNSGIPLSMLPTILESIKLHELLKDNEAYMKLYYILNLRLRVPLMSTGSDIGNIIEEIYLFILIVIFVLVIYIYRPEIRLL